MSSSDSKNLALLDELAEEFAGRYRHGERPSLAEYTDKYPDLADEIRSLFPAMVEIEQADVDRKAPADREAVLSAPALSQIGDFHLIREVGRGGMGIVYEAEQVSLGRRVALKVLPAQLLADTRQRQRFEREARSAAKLHHTNIVPVFGVGEEKGLHYYVMQFIQGLGLDEVLDELKQLQPGNAAPSTPARELRVSRKDVSAVEVARSLLTGAFHADAVGPGTTATAGEGEGEINPSADGAAEPTSATGRLSDSFSLSGSSVVLPGQSGGTRKAKAGRGSYWHGVAQIGTQVAGALDYAHKQGIHHRDIKPSNLLLDTGGTVWVTDFGLAKADDQQNLTHTGDILGTLRYMPPEAFEGRTDARGDIYSLGLTLYELLALRPAYLEKDRRKLIKEVTGAEAPRLERLIPQVPRDLVTIVHKAIEREPGHRYPSARDFADDLQRFLDDEPIKARRISPAERLLRWARHNRGLAASLSAIALLLLILTIGSLVAAAHFRQQERFQRELANENGRLVQEREAALASEAREKRQAETTLYHSLVREAQALRAAREVGYRDKAWARLKQALAIDTPDRNLDVLRREAVASLGDFVGREPVTWGGFDKMPGIVATHPDGKHLAVALANGIISIRTISTNKETARLTTGFQSRISDIQISPDSNHLLACDVTGSVKLWRRALDRQWTFVAEHQLGGRSKEATYLPLRESVLFFPDSRRFAACAAGGRSIEIRSLADMALDRIIRTPEDAQAFRCFDISSDGRSLAAAFGSRDDIAVWNVETGEVQHRFRCALKSIIDLAFSPDGRFLVCGTDQGFVTYETQSFQQWSLVRLDSVGALTFTPDSQYLALGTITRRIKLWSLTAQREVAVMDHPDRWTSIGGNLIISGDGNRLISADATEIRVWELRGLAEKRLLVGHPDSIPCVAFSPDGKWLATGSKESTVRLWDADSGGLLHTISLQGLVQTVAFSPDGRLLAIGDWSKNDNLTVWDLRTYQRIAAPKHRVSNVTRVAFTPDGKHLAAVGERGLTIFDILKNPPGANGKLELELKEATYQPGARSLYLAISPDSKTIAWVDRYSGVRIWDLEHQRERPFPTTFLQLAGWHNLAFHPDNRHILFVANNGNAEVWDAFAGQKVYHFDDAPRFQSFHIALSPNGRWLAGDARPGAVTLCDTTTRRALFTLGEERAPIWSLAWSPDNRRLAVGLSDGGLVIWDLEAIRAQLDEIGLAW